MLLGKSRRWQYDALKKRTDNYKVHTVEIVTNLERRIAGLQAIIDGPEQIRDPFTLELCVEREEYLKLHLEHEALKAEHADLKQLHQTMLAQAANKVTSLIATHTEVLDTIRAYCEVTEMDGEGAESYALRQYVASDADAEAKREMEEG